MAIWNWTFRVGPFLARRATRVAKAGKESEAKNGQEGSTSACENAQHRKPSLVSDVKEPAQQRQTAGIEEVRSSLAQACRLPGNKVTKQQARPAPCGEGITVTWLWVTQEQANRNPLPVRLSAAGF
jgi:hypothetical protein